jgi:hypothetical protein
MSNSLVFYSLKVIAELTGDIFYFSLWWYTRGLAKLFFGLKNFLADKQRALALLVWLKNIFKPMYAQYDWQGILVSFLVRSAQIIFRSIIMLFWLALTLLALALWLLLPPFAVYEIIFQLT